MASGLILVVDDSVSIRRVLRMTLREFGFTTIETANGEDALSLVRETPFDAVLLDLNLPDMNGIDTCRIMRMVLPRIPILIITVSDSEDDKVGALDAGANDYITKPFHLRELVARIHSAMRWAQPIVPPEEEQVTVLRVGEIELDLVRRKMIKASRVVHLTPTEFSLTRELMSYAGQPISHSQLLKYVWGPDYEDERDYLRTYIHQLRKKIEDDPSNPKYLLTDVNFGYRFVEKL